jgi:uncharacterized protein YbcI
MTAPDSTIAQRLAEVSTAFQQKITGRAPSSVTVMLGDETLVIALHGVLSPAERALANSEAGAAEVQDYHRQLFIHSLDSLRADIQQITGVKVCDGVAEVMPRSGTAVRALTSGTVVQVFTLEQRLPAQIWSATESLSTVPD